jgi:Flp pilus assembly CpaF family ATPase
MPTSMIRNDNLAASTKTANILSGDINEFITQPSIVNVYAVESAAGVRISVFADSDIAIDDKEVPNIGTTIDNSAHLIDSFTVNGGTRLAATLRETAAVATTDSISKFEVLPLV